MKQDPNLRKAQENMRPGVITVQGFLGPDQRDLVQIIDEDDAKVKALGLSHQQIAERMKELRDAGKAGLGDFIDVPPHYSVKVDSVRGKLRSPFGDPGLISKCNTTVHNKKNNREITYTDMSISFIEKHRFYQGKGSLFRLEPEDLAAILDITPSENINDINENELFPK